MSDQSENAFLAAIKALSEVVAPAVDRSNPLAQEQLRLVVMFLEFHLERRDLVRKLDWTELRISVVLGGAVADCLISHDPLFAGRLSELVSHGQAGLLATGSPASHWQALSSDILNAVSEAVLALAEGDPEVRQSLETLVLNHASAILELKRTWFLNFGFEARPESLPSLEQVFQACPQL